MSAPATELANVATVAVRDGSRAEDDSILADEKLWQVISSGDLKELTPKQKSDYYLYRCRQEGLNPASQPFQYVTFQGKETLYAGKIAADQLRKIHGVSIVSAVCRDDGEIIECEVHVRDREGRTDVEFGTVFVGTSRGQDRANAKLKCLTKAKRRATFSICGTGVLDETEIETIAGARTITDKLDQEADGRASAPQPLMAPEEYEAVNRAVKQVFSHQVDMDTGEIETAETVMAEIKALRERLGWSATNVSKHGQERGINLRTFDGLRAMRTLLEHYVTEEDTRGAEDIQDAEFADVSD